HVLVHIATTPRLINILACLSQCAGALPDLHSFPTRRSSDLVENAIARNEPDELLQVAIAVSMNPVGRIWSEQICVRLSKHPHPTDRKSTRLNSSHVATSYAVFCLKKNTPRFPSGPERWPSAT